MLLGFATISKTPQTLAAQTSSIGQAAGTGGSGEDVLDASWGESGSSVLSVTSRCCCEIRREVGTPGSHAHSLTF